MQAEWQTTEVPDDGTPVFVLLAKPWAGSRVHSAMRRSNIYMIGGQFSYNVPSVVAWCHQMELPDPLKRFYVYKYIDGRWADLYCSMDCAKTYHTDDIENEPVEWLLSFSRQSRRCQKCNNVILSETHYDKLTKKVEDNARRSLPADYWRD